MNLSARHTRLVTFVVGEELARRRRSGMPIPALLLELDKALNCNLDASAHETGCETTPLPRIETVKQRARRQGVSESTVRRNARLAGIPKRGRDYIFEN